MFKTPARLIVLLGSVAIGSLVVSTPAASAAPVGGSCTVTVTDLGAGRPHAINNQGQIAGQGARPVAVIWDKNGVATTLTGLAGSGHDTARDINNAGQAVGGSFVLVEGSSKGRAVTWSKNGVPTALPLLPGTDTGGAWGINSRGVIVGGVAGQVPAPWGGTWEGSGDAVMWTPTPGGYTATRLAGLPGREEESYYAVDVNDAGQIVGIVYGGEFGDQALTWDKNGNVTVLPTLPGSISSVPAAINNRGEIVGTVTLEQDNEVRAVVWKPLPGGGYTITDLGTLPGATFQSFRPLSSRANDINNRGQIVGISKTADNQYRAVIWTPTAGGGYSITDLGTLPGDFQSEAFAINDQGQVAGWSWDRNGNNRVARWDTRC